MLVDIDQISKEVKEILPEVELSLIRDIQKHMFRVVRDTMEKGDYESVYLQYLGTFSVLPSRLFYLSEKGVTLNEKGIRIVEQYKRDRNEYN